MVDYNDIASQDQVAMMLRRDPEQPEADDDGRISVIRLRLMQSNSAEVSDGEASPGDYYLDGYGVVPRPVLIYPLGLNPGRTFFDSDTRDILCRSQDGKTGTVTEDGDAKAGYGGECAKCPMVKWDPKPKCTEHLDIAIQLPDYGVLAVYRFASTHLRVAEMINTHRRMHGWGLFAEELTSVEATRRQFRFYKPKISLKGVRASTDVPFPFAALQAAQDGTIIDAEGRVVQDE